VTSEAWRLEQRARRPRAQAVSVTWRDVSPSQDLQQAKLALQDSSRRLQGDAEVIWLPVAGGMQEHPWRTLGMVVAAGAAFGWVDDATHGALSRLTWRALRTRILASGLRLP